MPNSRTVETTEPRAASLQPLEELYARLAMLHHAAAAIHADADVQHRNFTPDEASEITAIYRWFLATEQRIARLEATG